MNTPFDKNDIYTSLIEEKINELKKICSCENMPMFIAVCVSNNESETVFKKEAVTAATQGMDLTDDMIPKLIDITLGFDAVPTESIIEIDFE